MADRKIIFKCKVGSHLYGTNDEDSDTDYYGVFLPSTQDLLGLSNCPTEWDQSVKVSSGDRNTKDDTDCKLFSLRRWMELALEGQPGQLEMLFAPKSAIVESSWEWIKILANKDIFLSKSGINPFVGFALSQAHKSAIKGKNLDDLLKLQTWGQTLTPQQAQSPVCMFFETSDDGEWTVLGRVVGVERITNEQGFKIFQIAGRQYDIMLKTKTFLQNVEKLLEKYGPRSYNARAEGLDYKSLSHAIRLVGEAKEYLQTGNITLPRPNAHYLYTIKKHGQEVSKELGMDWFDYIQNELTELRTIKENSKLSDKPNRSKAEVLCQALLMSHLGIQDIDPLSPLNLKA